MKCLFIEKYTVQEILRIIHEQKLTAAVDLVEGGHVTLLYSQPEEEAARADAKAAEDAGVDMSGLEWINVERMKEV